VAPEGGEPEGDRPAAEASNWGEVASEEGGGGLHSPSNPSKSTATPRLFVGADGAANSRSGWAAMGAEHSPGLGPHTYPKFHIPDGSSGTAGSVGRKISKLFSVKESDTWKGMTRPARAKKKLMLLTRCVKKKRSVPFHPAHSQGLLLLRAALERSPKELKGTLPLLRAVSLFGAILTRWCGTARS